MLIHLPIAEMSVGAVEIIALGGVVGFLSGIFGVGGGFLTTPLLIFLGLPPAVAVGTQSCQLVASSVTGTLGHLRRGNVDVRMGLVMLAGGLAGTAVGIGIFGVLQHFGQIDLTLAVLYILFLGGVGGAMLVESALALAAQHSRRVRAWRGVRAARPPSPLLARLPWQMTFARSQITISALVPGGIGFVGGLLVAIMGIGGGFMMVPAMIYILGMPTLLVAGTSLLQIAATSAFATVLHATANGTVDIVLAALLIAGGLLGTRMGVSVARFVTGAVARVLLALLVLAVALAMGREMLIGPADPFSVVVRQAHAPAPAPALELAPEGGQGRLLIALSAGNVDVDTGFKGGQVAVFGVQRARGAVAVEVFGPARTTVVSRKDRVLGVWVNVASQTFPDLAQFYAYALSEGAQDPGLAALIPPSPAPQDAAFRSALIQRMQGRALLPTGRGALESLAPDAFVARFALPPDAPVGAYTVRATLRRQDGHVLGAAHEHFTLDQVGLGGQAHAFSRGRPWAYGLICVILAGLAGWGMSVISIRR